MRVYVVYTYIYICVCRYKYAFIYIYRYRYTYTGRYRYRYTCDILLFNSTSVCCRNTVYTSYNHPYLWMFVNQTLWLRLFPHILSPPGPTCSAPIAPCCCRLHCRDSGNCNNSNRARPRATSQQGHMDHPPLKNICRFPEAMSVK